MQSVPSHDQKPFHGVLSKRWTNDQWLCRIPVISGYHEMASVSLTILARSTFVNRCGFEVVSCEWEKRLRLACQVGHLDCHRRRSHVKQGVETVTGAEATHRGLQDHNAALYVGPLSRDLKERNTGADVPSEQPSKALQKVHAPDMCASHGKATR